MKPAIIWDFDGTLVDTRVKNLNVTRKIIEHVTDQNYQDFPAISSLQQYLQAISHARNWQELYRNEFDFDDKTIDAVGRMWTRFQLEDETPTKIFPELVEVLQKLAVLPHGIFSQNSRENIIKILREYKLDDLFKCIVGFEEIDMNKQKPDPSGLLQCIESASDIKLEKVLYIGDHEADILCAINANLLLHDIEIIPVAAHYGMLDDIDRWNVQPCFILNKPKDLINIIKKISYTN